VLLKSKVNGSFAMIGKLVNITISVTIRTDTLVDISSTSITSSHKMNISVLDDERAIHIIL
jgi:hypothetical protein